MDLNGDFAFTNGVDAVAKLGVAGDRPIPADLFGAGRHMLNVYRPSTGAWITEYGTVGSFGGTTSLPVAAPWQ